MRFKMLDQVLAAKAASCREIAAELEAWGAPIPTFRDHESLIALWGDSWAFEAREAQEDPDLSFIGEAFDWWRSYEAWASKRSHPLLWEHWLDG